ncbi:hypothetical protein L7F22_012587 [Adiantum nelumboides]|nr:hypothetical protein [Adiantum nelumboides]
MVSRGLQPDQVVVLSVLKACCRPGALVHGKLIHMEVVKNSYDTHIAVGTILVHMYAKFGHMQDAQSLFNGMQSKNIAIWNAMVGGYALYGDWKQGKECLAVLKAEGMRPDGTTYTNVLAACSHGGQVAAAHQSLQSITETNGRDFEMEHYNCFVDVLGRGRKMLYSMPVLPSVITWMSLLAACKTYKQTDLGRACFQQIIKLDPNAAGGYTIMSNIYAEAQKWEDFSALQEFQKCAGAWKLHGKAWIEVNHEVFEFVVDHPESALLLPMLRHMHVSAKAGGYVPDLDSTFQVSSWIRK